MEIIGIIVGALLLLLFLGALIIGFADACGEAVGEGSIYPDPDGEKIK